MDAEKLDYFRNILTDEMKTLLSEAGKTVTVSVSNFPATTLVTPAPLA